MKAGCRFEYRRGYKFSTYASGGSGRRSALDRRSRTHRSVSLHMIERSTRIVRTSTDCSTRSAASRPRKSSPSSSAPLEKIRKVPQDCRKSTLLCSKRPSMRKIPPRRFHRGRANRDSLPIDAAIQFNLRENHHARVPALLRQWTPREERVLRMRFSATAEHIGTNIASKKVVLCRPAVHSVTMRPVRSSARVAQPASVVAEAAEALIIDGRRARLR